MTIYEQLLNFVKTNTKSLCTIYIQERQKQGPGIIFIYYGEETKDVKVVYIAKENLTELILEEYNKRQENASENIIYFFVNNEEQSSFIELDIRDYA
jgi:hypothetical protein